MGFTTVVQYTYALSSLKFIVSSSCENIKIKTGMLYSGGLNGSSVCAGVVLVNPICPQKHGKKKKKVIGTLDVSLKRRWLSAKDYMKRTI